MGCVNHSGCRDRHLIAYAQGLLLGDQKRRPDIMQRIEQELQKHGNHKDFSEQYAFIKKGCVWAQFIRKDRPEAVEIQITGFINKGLQILS
jgi:hypothetical protein